MENGQIVYYKRVGEVTWQGPGTIIGRDCKVVLVRHGDTYIRAHECHLQVAKDKLSAQEKENDENVVRENITV